MTRPPTRKLSVLIVVNSMSDGGMSRYVIDLLKNIDRSSYSLHLVCTHFEGPNFQEAAQYAESVHVLYSRSEIRKLWDLLRTLYKIRPDAVHSHVDRVGSVAAWLARIPVRIETVHLAQHWMSYSHPLLRWLSGKCTTRFAVCIQEEADMLAALVPSQKTTVVSPAVEPSRIHTLKTKSEAFPDITDAEQRFVVGTVARLDYQKGIPYFIEACAEIAQKCPDALFLLIGDGSARAEAEQLVKKHGLCSRMRLMGFVPRAVKWLGAMDVFVMSSLFESWGFAVAEAMLAGVAAVSTDIPGPNSFIEGGRSGLLVPPKNSSAIAQAVLSLWSNPGLRQKIAESGREKILSTYPMRHFISRYEALYRGQFSFSDC